MIGLVFAFILAIKNREDGWPIAFLLFGLLELLIELEFLK